MVTYFILLCSKITADDDCSHKIIRHLLLGRKAMINLDRILKSRDITLPTKVRLVKTMVFPVQFSSFAQLCPTLCNPMNCSTPGLPVHHQLPELAQSHVHWVGNAIQPSYPLSSPSPPAFNLSQHQHLFQWVSSSLQVAKVLELQLQHLSFQWIFRAYFLYDWLVWSPCSPRDSQESSPTPQFKSINSTVLSFLYSPTLTSIHDYWKNHNLD